jgi:hypothetical protein
MKNLIITMFLVFLFSGGVMINDGLATQDEHITKTFKVKKGQLLTFKSDVGSVEIDSWDRNEMKFVFTLGTDFSSRKRAEDIFDDFDVSYDQHSRGVTIRVEYLKSKSWFGSRLRGVKVYFEIMVPREFDLDVKTAGGSIRISDIDGEVELNTSGGSIKTGEIGGPVNARSSGGSITVESADGRVDVHTSGGSISVGEATGSVYAETSGGGITLDGVDGNTRAYTSGGGLKLKNLKGNVEAKTSGGSIYAELTSEIDRDCSLRTSGGGITVYLPRDISAEIDASTSGGRVSTDFPVTIRGKISKRSLKGKINNGGPLIYLRTSGGSIRIKEL